MPPGSWGDEDDTTDIFDWMVAQAYENQEPDTPLNEEEHIYWLSNYADLSTLGSSIEELDQRLEELAVELPPSIVVCFVYPMPRKQTQYQRYQQY